MGHEFIETTMEGGLGTITLNRPPVNVLHMAMMEEINAVLESWKGKEDLKVILFNAKGKCFSAGVDVGEHMGDLAPKMIGIFHRMFRLMDEVGILTAASVYGSCLGGGCELAAFCDLVISADDAKFGQPEIQVGVFPPIAAQLFPRIMGRKAAMELILSGKIISSEEALRIGLVNRVVPREELEGATSEFLKPYLKLSAAVLSITRKAIFSGLRDDFEPSLAVIEELYLNELMKTHDANEGLEAFLDKRKPVWKNA
ncbi:MAG: enoyl-CoA hydratase/isomerase family protein [Deltaproteobacteria bacterium]|nr:enoyl-CoA hydratase/isomerase family protein [Deltaproteobacteria bacterium]MBW1922146.1 enoyl-CoA hydratase/isomerase family protein [Deltaproteobacteria bacterium]MBW1947963.1 enoyl-CoA hydratase/isomerase family protein [Deltaproteobacteria bacterium]MBW2007302.1 enoyl-CoA hydratase/isomerase family protein [Deltaproteobacteria bacterium]MBW2104145.1 enoyl-CoA hydratase/isomerase family protein [Deltaproteobacteria bacterium]